MTPRGGAAPLASADARTALQENELLRFRELILERSGLVVGDRRQADLERAVIGAVEETGSADAEDLFRLLNADAGRPQLEAFIAGLTVGETHFFRNRAQMQALERFVLPDIIERRKDTRRIRIWSAGCASGEEPYTIAILLDRLLPDLEDWSVTILATDINRRALEKAQRRVFTPWSFREVPPEIERAYFRRRDRAIEMDQRLAGLVTFGYLNLVEDVYPSLLNNTNSMDLILCRNVLIYFRQETCRSVVARLRESLVDGGWLLVGAPELSQGMFEEFESQDFPDTIVYRKGESVASSEASGSTKPPAGTPPPTRPWLPRDASSVPLTAARAEETPVTDEPTDGPAMVGLAEATGLWTNGEIGEALAGLASLVDAYPRDARVACLAARICADRLRLEEAERWVSLAIEREPLLPSAHYLHGLILLEAGREATALVALRSCIYADPAYVLGHFAIAGLLARLRRLPRARKELDIVESLLQGIDREAEIPDGDGVTAGRLLELVAVQRELLGSEGGER